MPGWQSFVSHASWRDLPSHCRNGQGSRAGAAGQGNCKDRERTASCREQIEKQILCWSRPRASCRGSSQTPEKSQRTSGDVETGEGRSDLKNYFVPVDFCAALFEKFF